MEVLKVRLYVKSLKKAAGVENIVIDKPSMQNMGGGRAGNILRVYPTQDVRNVTKYEYELPEEQEHLIEIVKEVVAKVGLKLEIIDVGKMDFLDEPLPKEVKQLKNFPVVATESKTQLATGFTREDIERFLSNR